MLEVVLSEVAIVACLATRAALDGLSREFGVVLRIAPDEAWLLGARAERSRLMASAASWLGGADSGGLVVDQTDGWTVWAVRGSAAIELFGRLSVAPVPAGRPALVQGALAGVPGKALFANETLYLMVPAPVGHHLEARIRETGVDLDPRFARPEPFAATAVTAGPGVTIAEGVAS